jgi:hypothetical protein
MTFPETTPGFGNRPGTIALVNGWPLRIGCSHFAQIQCRRMSYLSETYITSLREGGM